ncbi:hypothetical protein ROS62_24185 [Streptomyces sp. DSM 41972]|uniref:Uncharacterized protein n=1 Tax=Streptomyces althioticus subsp. attaecolombicae TaxID=3075534 RepID=A0ABU3I4C0_9ACTN|nr:hypothetical protein [Streptomyces sp. DSM 41972]SCD63075.1 hypothetical protein GA0115238_11868 [Streptomyces sp. di50b]SCD65353.1 hypothetical protein GA0115245_11098 [Streptomyces sp. di188]
MDRRHRAQEPPQRGPRPPQAPPPGNYCQPAPAGWGPPPQPPPKKKHRVFLWVFLAIQVVFLIWVIWGIAQGSGTPEQCRGRTGDDLDLCNSASDAGTAIGVWLVIAVWAAVDVILGITYAIYRLAARRT